MTTKKVLAEKARAVVDWWSLIDTMPTPTREAVMDARDELNDRIRALGRALS